MTPQPGAIFILSPLPRSGTNFLWDLLRVHPDVTSGRSPIREDYFLANSDHLTAFVDAMHESWDPVWGPTAQFRPELTRGLGDALLAFLTRDPTRRLVTKTPTLKNLEVFFDFFPDAHLLLLMRDGRDAVDSGMKTFGWELEGAARAWAAGVDRITRFSSRHDIPSGQCTIVRYEDLHHRLADEMTRVLTALGLDPARYDFDAAEKIPVRGSSTHRGDHPGGVHWGPVPREPSFKPTQRWKAWDVQSRKVLYAVAGAQLGRLGYER